MKQRNVRVLLASEHPGTRSLIRHLVDTGNGAIIVAEAENGTSALTLARDLRPDVAVIDSFLPHIAGIDRIPSSRVSGFDVAQSISADMPDARVILVNSLSENILNETSWRTGNQLSLCRESENTCIPFTIAELGAQDGFKGNFIFANIESTLVPQQDTKSLDNVIFSGVLCILTGWFLILTMFLATIGLFAVMAGAIVILTGFIGKLVSNTLDNRF